MRTAIFGGAFDPFHSEHRNIIISTHDYLNLDRVVVVPSFLPPHKNSLCSSYELRRKMVEAGTTDLPYVIIDDIELHRNTVNPTSEILPILKEKYGGEIFFVMGGDSVKNFSSWINPRIIASTATLCLIQREGCGNFKMDVEALEKNFGAKTVVVPYIGKKVSSSCVKAYLELNLPTEDIPQGVRKIIDDNRLYKKFLPIVTLLKNDVSEKTFNHCVSTALYAENFAGVNKLSFEEVFLSCLLHDCAKNLHIKMEGVPDQVVHQFVGAERARDYYGIENEKILNAIRYHTTGKPNMTTLEKLTFSADMLEPNRNFEGVETLRKIMDKDFEEGFLACLNATYAHLKKSGCEIYSLTKECFDYYN